MSDGLALLERSVAYTLGGLTDVTPAALADPTPCRGWDLRALLDHLNDSLAALAEAVGTGSVELDPAPPAGGDPVGALRAHGRRLLGAGAGCGDRVVAVGGRPLTTGLVTGTGAVEIAVHGWDVARACRRPRPIPDALAVELLELVPLFVTPADRPVRFAAPVPVPPSAGPADRLLAFLGRHPG
jgi:uncharacterized protein (TIGR03086 family)